MNSVDISCEGVDPPPWIDSYRTLCNKALDMLGAAGWEVSVLLCDNPTIRRLNHGYRGEDTPTDVLSFPQEENGAGFDRYRGVVGDVVISLDYLRDHLTDRSQLSTHLLRLTIHGLLHLAGYDHDRPEARADMERIQEEVVKEISEDFNL